MEAEALILTSDFVALCRQELFQCADERRKVFGDNFPYNVQVYVEVPMDQAISRAGDLFPGDIRSAPSSVIRNAFGGLSKYFEQAREGPVSTFHRYPNRRVRGSE